MLILGLEQGANCSLIGWGGVTVDARGDEVTVLGPNSCEGNLPNIFCSNFHTEDHETCSAILGSPVVCDNAIGGFLLNDKECEKLGSKNHLRYLSTGPFASWIQEVTEEDKLFYPQVEFTRRFIVNIVHYKDTESATVACAGTIIAPNHVLTTASCVKVSGNLKIGVRTLTATGSSTSKKNTLKNSLRTRG